MNWREYLSQIEPPAKEKTKIYQPEPVADYSYEQLYGDPNNYESPHSLQNTGSHL